VQQVGKDWLAGWSGRRSSKLLNEVDKKLVVLCARKTLTNLSKATPSHVCDDMVATAVASSIAYVLFK